MSQPFEITIYNRYTKSNEIEKVYGDAMVKFAYDSILGKGLAKIIASKVLSQSYGFMQDRKKSAGKVSPFIDTYSIQINDYEKGSYKDKPIAESYKSFNEFFIRTFKAGLREFTKEKSKMAAFSEARYFGHDAVTDDLKVPVKGSMIKAIDLLGNKEIGEEFMGGPFLIARLCPVDYHRYHYPDAGTTLNSYTVHGDYHSVNPLALKFRQDILIKNERRVSIVETENFGKLAIVEVGATCVGKIIQSFDESKKFTRGDEKGYFLFGGSTVIIYGQAGKWKPSLDILENTKLGLETYIHLGDEVADLIDS